jgi:hypothetical protein
MGPTTTTTTPAAAVGVPKKWKSMMVLMVRLLVETILWLPLLIKIVLMLVVPKMLKLLPAPPLPV